MRAYDPLTGTPEQFHERLTQAFTKSALTPDKKHGRNVWISNQLRTRGVTASPESVRKWFAGLTMPRGDTMLALAEIIGVTAEWLENGDGELVEPTKREDLDAEMRLVFDAAHEIDWDEVNETNREIRENSAAAAMVGARLMFAGIEHQLAGPRVMISAKKNVEVAVVVLQKIVNRGGYYTARLPKAASGFQIYTTSYDVLMFVLPRGGRDPLLFAVNGKAANRLGEPESVIQVQESFEDDETRLILTAAGKPVMVDPIPDLALLSLVGG